MLDIRKLLKIFTASRAKDFSIEYYDHNIIRPNHDKLLNENRFANPQLTENFFIKTSYLFTFNIFDKKHDHIISEALVDIQAYESFYDKFQLFSLTFHFLLPQKRDLHCSHVIRLRTKQTHTYTYYRLIQNHFDLYTPSRQPHHRFQFINSKYTSPFFLNYIALKILTSMASSAITIQLPKCIYFAPSRRPSMMKNQDPSLSRMNSYNLSKYPY